jgi:hypothetical protein
LSVLKTSQADFLEAVDRDFRHYRLPPLRFAEYLASLEKAGLPELANALASHRDIIERAGE